MLRLRLLPLFLVLGALLVIEHSAEAISHQSAAVGTHGLIGVVPTLDGRRSLVC